MDEVPSLWIDDSNDQDFVGESPDISNTFLNPHDIVLHLGDTYDFLQTLPSNFVQLVITSPPYNVGKEYETRVRIQEYLYFQKKVIQELVRVTAANGNICWQVGNYVEDSEVFPLDILYYDIFKRLGLKLRNRIIWRYNHGLHTSKRFSGRYETILWFSKTDNYIFNLDAVRVPSKYPGKRNHKGPRKGKPSGNPLGKNPSDIWDIVVQDWEEEVWEIPQVKAAHLEKTIHPAQYPIELVERCVLALTDKESTVLDPYCGVGSSLIGALKHQRKAIGCDKESLYVEIARERIKKLYRGNLPIRPIERELYTPQGKVSRVPQEWLNGEVKHVYKLDKHFPKGDSKGLFESQHLEQAEE